MKDLGKQHSSPSLRSSPDRRKSAISPEPKVKVIKSYSGGNISRERSPDNKRHNGTYFDNKDCVTKVIVHKSPRKSSLKSSKGSIERDPSPRGSFDRNKSPRGSIDRDRSPKGERDRSKSPFERGKSPRCSFDGAKSPQRCKSPYDRSKSPSQSILKKTKQYGRSPQSSMDRSPNKSPNLARRYSKSSQDRLAKLGTNSLDRANQYSPMAGYEDKAFELGIVVSKSTESIVKAIEKPTCVECYLSNKKSNKS